MADGVDQVMKAARQQIAAGADLIKVYGSTGSADDVTGYQTYTVARVYYWRPATGQVWYGR